VQYRPAPPSRAQGFKGRFAAEKQENSLLWARQKKAVETADLLRTILKNCQFPEGIG
jgi:hypothetical protein